MVLGAEDDIPGEEAVGDLKLDFSQLMTKKSHLKIDAKGGPVFL